MISRHRCLVKQTGTKPVSRSPVFCQIIAGGRDDDDTSLIHRGKYFDYPSLRRRWDDTLILDQVVWTRETETQIFLHPVKAQIFSRVRDSAKTWHCMCGAGTARTCLGSGWFYEGRAEGWRVEREDLAEGRDRNSGNTPRATVASLCTSPSPG